VAAKNCNIEEVKELWRQEPDDNIVFRAATEDIEGYALEVQAVIKAEAERRRKEQKKLTTTQAEKDSGKQRARIIAFVLIILIIIGEIQKVAKGDNSLYAGIANIAIEVVVMYYLVMLIARYLAKRKAKRRAKQ